MDDDFYINIKSLVRALSHFDPDSERVYLGRAAYYQVQGKSRLGHLGDSFGYAQGAMYCLSRPMMEIAKPYVV